MWVMREVMCGTGVHAMSLCGWSGGQAGRQTLASECGNGRRGNMERAFSLIYRRRRPVSEQQNVLQAPSMCYTGKEGQKKTRLQMEVYRNDAGYSGTRGSGRSLWAVWCIRCTMYGARRSRDRDKSE
ncbi:hypothetical protein GY45DRAFT_476642 [Cubamyces sp. BRFM 1775]|nr:hypothetical protein GY45DRAFT_476642 [Cubamyces sp. BRFM 1775]